MTTIVFTCKGRREMRNYRDFNTAWNWFLDFEDHLFNVEFWGEIE